MQDALFAAYPWVKSFHVIAVIAWMAGIFYLPRLFVYHVESVKDGSETAALFQIMERKLLRVIMNPAMIVTWVAGLFLVLTPGIIDWSAFWPWAKTIAVLGMTWFHMWLGGQRKAIAAGENRLTGRQYRMMNEVPTVLMIIIVIAVIARPF